MPNNIIKSFAKQSRKSEKEVEKLWKDAIKISEEELGKKEKSFGDREWSYVTGILKSMLGIKESFVDLPGVNIELLSFSEDIKGNKTLILKPYSNKKAFMIKETKYIKLKNYSSLLEIEKDIECQKDIVNSLKENKEVFSKIFNLKFDERLDSNYKKVEVKSFFEKEYNLKAEEYLQAKYDMLYNNTYKTNNYAELEDEDDMVDAFYDFDDYPYEDDSYEDEDNIMVITEPEDINIEPSIHDDEEEVEETMTSGSFAGVINRPVTMKSKYKDY